MPESQDTMADNPDTDKSKERANSATDKQQVDESAILKEMSGDVVDTTTPALSTEPADEQNSQSNETVEHPVDTTLVHVVIEQESDDESTSSDQSQPSGEESVSETGGQSRPSDEESASEIEDQGEETSDTNTDKGHASPLMEPLQLEEHVQLQIRRKTVLIQRQVLFTVVITSATYN